MEIISFRKQLMAYVHRKYLILNAQLPYLLAEISLCLELHGTFSEILFISAIFRIQDCVQPFPTQQ